MCLWLKSKSPCLQERRETEREKTDRVRIVELKGETIHSNGNRGEEKTIERSCRRTERSVGEPAAAAAAAAVAAAAEGCRGSSL